MKTGIEQGKDAGYLSESQVKFYYIQEHQIQGNVLYHLKKKKRDTGTSLTPFTFWIGNMSNLSGLGYF